ncbi:hypothetical protein AMS68_006004 [Peltaster fructicola]|uniref:Uncharacterized protein n=1 Tax=Peltaster fructicola TaxID=286661 RepID=A0A6H0Y0F9_9PEZI|nr:hypothetical protein AMS68_006004 [Peltaster fructicola]
MFAPVYRPPRSQQSYLTRHHEQAQKKRRPSLDEGEDSDLPDSPDISTPPFKPIAPDDPYLTAGYSREKTLPPFPFPHAPVESERPVQVSLDEELFCLKPTVHKLDTQAGDAYLTKRQHLDNLTALLHRSVTTSDWNRASRIIGLLLRSDFNGAIDLRRHGRWAIAGEILMRREQSLDADNQAQSVDRSSGFEDTRKYYERMILQYPHTSRTSSSFSAATIYPSLFNVWVYEVQQRSKVGREACQRRPSSSSSLSSCESTDDKDDVSKIRLKELEEAEPIATRLDDLLLSPPYDTDVKLLHLRAMIGSWLSDLYTSAADSVHSADLQRDHYRQSNQREKDRAEDLLDRIAQRTI